MGVNSIVAAVVAAVVLLFWTFRYRQHWVPQFEANDPPDRGDFAAFVKATPNLKDDGAPVLLAERVEKLYDELNDATKNQESKATTILGFVGGGASLYALAVDVKAVSHPPVSPLLVLGLVLFFVALIGCLLCLVGRRRRGLPELDTEFAHPAVLDSADTNKARVAGYLFMIEQDRYDSYRRINIVKSYFIELALQAFAFGAFALVSNYVVAAYAPSESAKPPTTHCVLSGTTVTNSNAVDCTTKDGG